MNDYIYALMLSLAVLSTSISAAELPSNSDEMVAIRKRRVLSDEEKQQRIDAGSAIREARKLAREPKEEQQTVTALDIKQADFSNSESETYSDDGTDSATDALAIIEEKLVGVKSPGKLKNPREDEPTKKFKKAIKSEEKSRDIAIKKARDKKELAKAFNDGE